MKLFRKRFPKITLFNFISCFCFSETSKRTKTIFRFECHRCSVVFNDFWKKSKKQFNWWWWLNLFIQCFHVYKENIKESTAQVVILSLEHGKQQTRQVIKICKKIAKSVKSLKNITGACVVAINNPFEGGTARYYYRKNPEF